MRMPSTITISRQTYNRLKKEAGAFHVFMRGKLSIAKPLASSRAKKLVKDFRDSGIYTKSFLADLEKGLLKSSYGK